MSSGDMTNLQAAVEGRRVPGDFSPPTGCWKKIGVDGDGTCPRLAEFAICRNCPEYSRAGRSLLDREIPAGAREEWAELAAAARESADTGTLSVVVFRIGSQWLALQTMLFERWLAARPVHVVPGLTNDVFRGLVNVDGELLFCFDGPKMLGFDDGGGEAPGRMFVAARASDRFVFAVQEVLGVRRIPREAFEELPATLARSPAALTRATAAIENRKVGLLDADKFFACALRSLP
jgi:chemotaxis-related protein WspD